MPCEACKQEVPRYRLKEHLLDHCPKRPVKCGACKKEYRAEEKHSEEACRAKVEVCEHCRETISVVSLSTHKRFFCRTISRTSCPRCYESVLISEFATHLQGTCLGQPSPCTDCFDLVDPSFRMSHPCYRERLQQESVVPERPACGAESLHERVMQKPRKYLALTEEQKQSLSKGGDAPALLTKVGLLLRYGRRGTRSRRVPIDLRAARALFEQARTSEALRALVEMYDKGLGVPLDLGMRNRLLAEALAKDGTTWAVLYKSRLLLEGDGFAQDAEEALALVKPLIGKCSEALFLAGIALLQQKKESEGEKALEGAAKAGCCTALSFYGHYLLERARFEAEEEKAYSFLNRAAEMGDAPSLYTMGMYHYYQLDEKMKGLVFMNDSAAQGYTLAIPEAAGMWSACDSETGLERMCVAAAQGIPRALYAIGEAFRRGDGFLCQDHKEALKFYLRAATHPQALAAYYLPCADAYATGRGVTKNLSMAFLYYSRAASGGSPEGLFNLGLAWLNGLGTQKSVLEAVKAFSQAAEKGHSGAQFELGLLYLHGQGVTRNSTRGLELIYKAICEAGDIPFMFLKSFEYVTRPAQL